MGSCVTPWTVTLWSGTTVLSDDATEIASMPFPGPELNHEPEAPCPPRISLQVFTGWRETHLIARCDGHNLARCRDPARDYGCRALGPTVRAAKTHRQNVHAVLDSTEQAVNDDCAGRVRPCRERKRRYSPSSLTLPVHPKILYE
jgi:hypothetical protein